MSSSDVVGTLENVQKKYLNDLLDELGDSVISSSALQKQSIQPISKKLKLINKMIRAAKKSDQETLYPIPIQMSLK